jgi:Flp pilus assembly protein TadG
MGLKQSRLIRRGAKTRGMAMVETLMVLPVLLLVLFAMTEFSIVFSRWQALSNAAREGARTAIVFRAPCVAGDVESEVRQRVRNYSSSSGITLTDEQIDVQGVCGDPTTNARVQITAPYTFRVVGAMAPSLSPTINTTGTSVMRNEGTG